MADRKVTHIRKNQEGIVTHLCNPGQKWSPIGLRVAVIEISAGFNRYYVTVDGQQLDVAIGYGSPSFCLRTASGATIWKYLEELPED